MEKVTLEVYVSKGDLSKYGKEGVKNLLIDILERYGSEEYYDPDLVAQAISEVASEEAGSSP